MIKKCKGKQSKDAKQGKEELESRHGKPPISCEELSERIRKELQMPNPLNSIVVKHLWDNRYRVNVFSEKSDNTIFGKRVYMHSSYFIRFKDNSLYIQPDDKFSVVRVKKPGKAIEKIYNSETKIVA